MHIYYIEKLQAELALRQERSPSYSLRAFARDLGINSASLSQILNGQRSIPKTSIKNFVSELKLSPEEKALFIESIYKRIISLDDIKIDLTQKKFKLQASHGEVIAEWEHYAVLSLFDFDNFECTKNTVAFHLGISPARTEEVIQNLLKTKLLIKDGSSYQKNFAGTLHTSEDIKDLSLKLSHEEALEIAKEKLEIDVEKRDFSSVTFAVDPEKLQELKTITREFRQKVMALTKNGNKSEVYQMSIQLFPLTDLNRASDEE